MKAFTGYACSRCIAAEGRVTHCASTSSYATGYEMNSASTHLRSCASPSRRYSTRHPTSYPTSSPPPRRAPLPTPRSSFVGRHTEIAAADRPPRAPPARHADGHRRMRKDPTRPRGRPQSSATAHRRRHPHRARSRQRREPGRRDGDCRLGHAAPRTNLPIPCRAPRGSRSLLILVDNCEHLIETCAELVHELLSACPSVRVLATSREPLRADGEAHLRRATPRPRHRRHGTLPRPCPGGVRSRRQRSRHRDRDLSTPRRHSARHRARSSPDTAPANSRDPRRSERSVHAAHRRAPRGRPATNAARRTGVEPRPVDARRTLRAAPAGGVPRQLHRRRRNRRVPEARQSGRCPH